MRAGNLVARLLATLLLTTAVHAADPHGAPTRALCDGERYGTEWLSADGINVGFDRDDALFGNDEGGGGFVERIAYPPASDNHALLIRDTTAGKSGNAGSGFRWRTPRDSAFAKRVNEILARPEGEAPVAFAVSFRLARLTEATRLVHVDCSAEWVGGRRPGGHVFVGKRSFRDLPAYREGRGFQRIDAGVFPSLRFLVQPSGGKHQVDGIELRFGVRVDWNSTDETLVIDDLALHEIVSPPPLTEYRTTVAFIGEAPSPAFLDAARALQCRVLPTSYMMDTPADVYVVDRRLDDPKLAGQCVKALQDGKTLILAMEEAMSGVPAELGDCLPINTWSVERWNLRRYDSTLQVPTASPWAEAETLPALALGRRVDLHLPFAPVETPLQRYHWERFGKDLLNTDWRVLLTCGLDGQLPALISGRCGPGRILVFAGSLCDPLLATSPGYPSLTRALLREALQQQAPAQSVETTPVGIRVEAHQPDGLHVNLHNPGQTPARLLLLYKIRNWARELRNAGSLEVTVAGGATRRITLPERHPDVGQAFATSCEENVNLRRIELGLASPDRSRVLLKQEAVVSLAKPVALTFEEDPSTYAEMSDWPAGEIQPDGRLGKRYVYRTGTSPRITLKLSNGLMNLAPLARAQDRNTPENWSASGLNDLSYTHASARGSIPLQGGWSGLPAAEQRIALAWNEEVLVAAQRLVGQGSYRRWNDSNPPQYALIGKRGETTTTLQQAEKPEFVSRFGNTIAYCEGRIEQPASVRECLLHVTGLDPQRRTELKHWKKPGDEQPSNCTLLEWEVYGWPHREPPPTVRGTLQVTLVDLLSGERKVLLREETELAGLQELARELTIPARAAFGPVRVDANFATAEATLATGSFDVLFVPTEGTKLLNKQTLFDFEKGQLCSPGYVQVSDFGKGIEDQTRGWGGPDDKIWAYVNNVMSIGDRNRSRPERMFTSVTAASHYINPFRLMPNGVYSWEMVAEQMLANLKDGRWAHQLKDKNGDGVLRFHVIGSDAWNGANVGNAWGWGEFVAFDRYLRQQGGEGLKGRTIGEVAREIREHHGRDWQVWQMERYADQMIKAQELFREHGIEFTYETHGSFPLCGGELGAKIARTHIGVGTDLFWELRNQDLLWSLGSRFAIVASNPNLRSGAYRQWGWINSESNSQWYANNGAVEPARRQWYATYFVGRVTLDGAFEPYHVYGFTSQGGVGTHMNPDDIAACTRTINFTTQVRPEQAAGFGMVVSWANQERRMGKQLGQQGFGLYASEGEDQVDDLMAHAYHKLVKNGLPLGFVTSTHALKRWQGTQPLVLVDGYNLSDWELAEVKRLNEAGTPILAIGDAEVGRDLTASADFYGVGRIIGGWQPAADVRAISLSGGVPAYVRQRPGAGPVVLVPKSGRDLPGRAAEELVQEMLKLVGQPLSVMDGIAVTPFVSQGRLFLALLDQGDVSRDVTVELRPEWFLPELEGAALRAIDMDRAQALELKQRDGRLTLRLPVEASAGRLIMISKGDR